MIKSMHKHLQCSMSENKEFQSLLKKQRNLQRGDLFSEQDSIVKKKSLIEIKQKKPDQGIQSATIRSFNTLSPFQFAKNMGSPSSQDFQEQPSENNNESDKASSIFRKMIPANFDVNKTKTIDNNDFLSAISKATSQRRKEQQRISQEAEDHMLYELTKKMQAEAHMKEVFAKLRNYLKKQFQQQQEVQEVLDGYNELIIENELEDRAEKNCFYGFCFRIQQSKPFTFLIALCIGLNTLVLAMDTHPIEPQ